MKTLTVDLGERSYPIHIGSNLLSQHDLVSSHVSGTQVMIVTNDVVAPLYLQQAKSLFKDFECHVVILPDGEKHKTLTNHVLAQRVVNTGLATNGRIDLG